jgi:tetratricopeptide (TPR) repeat protein
MKHPAEELRRLITSVEWALARGLEERELLPMLVRLAARAPAGSPESLLAQLELSERTVGRDPWRAALLARRVLAHRDEARAWSVLGLAHTLLGNYRSARRAYLRALALRPSCLASNHNLGHLLDAALGQPRAALRYLAVAHRAHPADEEIAGSYAHALARAGRPEQAFRLLAESLGDPARARVLLDRWLLRPI